MVSRRTFIGGLLAVTAPLFIPAERLEFGVPHQIIIPEPPKLVSRDIIQYYVGDLQSFYDKNDKELKVLQWNSNGKWVDIGYFDGGLTFTSEISRVEISLDWTSESDRERIERMLKEDKFV